MVGLEKVEGSQAFPSDHWGIRVDLELRQQGEQGTSKKRKVEELD